MQQLTVHAGSSASQEQQSFVITTEKMPNHLLELFVLWSMKRGLMFCVSPQSMAAKYIAPATLFMQWLPAATI
ncbi:hypothetical protein PANN_34700 [Pseudomonas aeruginosa C-NN2]|nr:hypothetical protein PANN_34700 [Pseudomonas aeruginosa C-NN2]